MIFKILKSKKVLPYASNCLWLVLGVAFFFFFFSFCISYFFWWSWWYGTPLPFSLIILEARDWWYRYWSLIFWKSFASIENIKRKYNPMLDFSKSIYNKKILNEVVVNGYTQVCSQSLFCLFFVSYIFSFGGTQWN